MIRMLAVLVLVLVVPLAFLAGRASGQARTPCPLGQPCVEWQDVNSTKLQQDLVLYDHAGSPIWWVNNAGGMWVGHDMLGVTGSSVFNHAAYLSVPDGFHGELVIGGQVLTAADIAWLHRHGG